MYNAHIPRDRNIHDCSTSWGRLNRPIKTEMPVLPRVKELATTRIARGALLAVMLAGALLLAACGGGEDSLGTVHGLITDVQTRSITEIESFSIRDDAGETWLFITEGPLEATPSHLRQHMLIGQRVRVVFEDQAAGRVAVSILDFP